MAVDSGRGSASMIQLLILFISPGTTTGLRRHIAPSAIAATLPADMVTSFMSADLRCACPLDKDTPFLGMHRMLGDIEADNLDFATHNYTPKRDREGDYCQTSFFLEKNAESGQLTLWRRRNPTIGLDPLSGGKREEIATGVVGLRFEFFDGLDWYESWGEVGRRGKVASSLRDQPNLEGMPDAVRITLLMDPEPRAKASDSREISTTESTRKSTNAPPLVFQTVARLNLAALSQTSSSTSTGSSDSSTGTSTPGSNNGGVQ